MSVSPKRTSGSSSSWWGFHELAFIPHFKRSDLQIASFLSIFEVFSFFPPLSFFFFLGLVFLDRYNPRYPTHSILLCFCWIDFSVLRVAHEL